MTGVSLVLSGGLKGWARMRVCEVALDVATADWIESVCGQPCKVRDDACPLVPPDLDLSVVDAVNTAALS